MYKAFYSCSFYNTVPMLVCSSVVHPFFLTTFMTSAMSTLEGLMEAVQGSCTTRRTSEVPVRE